MLLVTEKLIKTKHAKNGEKIFSENIFYGGRKVCKEHLVQITRRQIT